MNPGRFDTDTNALTQRLKCNQSGTADLNEWIFSHIDFQSGHRVLELGCGTGEQTIPIAKMISPDGKIVGMDISKDAFDSIEKVALKNPEAGLNIRVIHADFDTYHLGCSLFDRVLAVYSIYYTKNAASLIRAIRLAMKPGGVFFCCGPAFENNMELKTMISTITGMPVPTEEIEIFMERELPHLLTETFGTYHFETFRFANTITFETPYDLISFWGFHNLFDPEYQSEFEYVAKVHYKMRGRFRLTKRAVGYRCVK